MRNVCKTMVVVDENDAVRTLLNDLPDRYSFERLIKILPTTKNFPITEFCDSIELSAIGPYITKDVCEDQFEINISDYLRIIESFPYRGKEINELKVNINCLVEDHR